MVDLWDNMATDGGKVVHSLSQALNPDLHRSALLRAGCVMHQASMVKFRIASQNTITSLGDTGAGKG